ncbi:MAG TPA: RNA polymerase sigma factor, partial [Isosphaeraceae bacterium]
MGQGSASAVLRGLRAVFDGGSVAGLADGPLLERFARRGEDGAAESAFAALVERHGPMVWRVCRATLRDEHEAEDAFQAVFLVLARKARTLWVRDSIGPWLHQVALRTSAYARSEWKRRRDLERGRAESAVLLVEEPPRDDSSPVIHEELGRLPDRYRSAVVLCDLEGLSHEEAALRLGWPIGTVKSRQARGRAKLRDCLIRRGLGPPAAMLMLMPSPSMPASLVPATVAAGLGLARNGASGGAVTLMKGVLMMMLVKRFQAVAAFVILSGSAASVAALAASRGGKPDDLPAKPAAAPAKKPTARPVRDLLRDAAKAAAPDGDVKAAAYILLDIARAQARAGDRAGALETARRVSATAEALGPRAARTLITLAYVPDAAGDRAGGLKELERADRLPDEQTGAIETPAGPNSKEWFPARRLVAEARYDLG